MFWLSETTARSTKKAAQNNVAPPLPHGPKFLAMYHVRFYGYLNGGSLESETRITGKHLLFSPRILRNIRLTYTLSQKLTNFETV